MEKDSEVPGDHIKQNNTQWLRSLVVDLGDDSASLVTMANEEAGGMDPWFGEKSIDFGLLIFSTKIIYALFHQSFDIVDENLLDLINI